jgi:Icc-related predicted phosphoesterase
MKILVGSDYHCKPNLLAEALDLIPKLDGYINCGDFCSHAGAQPLGQTGYHPKGKGEVELLKSFLGEVDQLAKPWIFLPGNHDPSALVLDPLAGSYGYVATQSTIVSLLGLRILMVPWTPPCGWNWTLTSKHLKLLLETYAHQTVDMIISHAPPKGILDEGGKWYHKKTPTLKPLVDLVQPQYYLCGHMHLDGGKQVSQGSTLFVNAALHNVIVDISPSSDHLPHIEI